MEIVAIFWKTPKNLQEQMTETVSAEADGDRWWIAWSGTGEVEASTEWELYALGYKF